MGEILSLDGKTGEYIIFSKPLNAVQQRMWEKCECEERHFSFVFNSTCKAFWQHLWFSKVKISVQLYFFFYFKSKWLISEECFCVCVQNKSKVFKFWCPFCGNHSATGVKQLLYCFGLAMQRTALCLGPAAVDGNLVTRLWTRPSMSL